MQHLYFASCVSNGGIYHYVEKNSQLTFREKISLDRPMYMVIKRQKAYVLLRETDAQNHFGGMISFEMDADGKLINATPVYSTYGVVPCHIAVDHDDIYIANYLSGNLIRMPDTVQRHFGKGINPSRQEAPHPHFVGVSPDKEQVMCVDLGTDSIYVYDRALNEKACIYTFPGYGPRHLVFDEDEQTMFCVYELVNAVSMLRRQKDNWSIINTILLDESECGGGAAIRIRDKMLYVSIRGADKIVRIEILPEGLRKVDSISCGGESPRDIKWAGKYLYSANECSDTVTLFSLSEGRLCQEELSLHIPHPLCICAWS